MQDTQTVYIQGKIRLVPEILQEYTPFWIPWKDTGICEGSCYIHLPVGTYVIKSDGQQEEIITQTDTLHPIVLTSTQADADTWTTEVTKEELRTEFLTNFPQYTDLDKKIIEEKGVIILYDTPVRIYDPVSYTHLTLPTTSRV